MNKDSGRVLQKYAAFGNEKGQPVRVGLVVLVGQVSLKLVLGTFFISMVVTNDVALIAIVPITLMLQTPYKGWLVILEALAANAGSALTPIGNPQNLFIYWHYQVNPLSFVQEIAPFSAAFLVLLIVLALRIPTHQVVAEEQMAETLFTRRCIIV